MRFTSGALVFIFALSAMVFAAYTAVDSRGNAFTLVNTLQSSADKIAWAAIDVDMDGIHDLVELIPIGTTGYDLSTRYGIGDGTFGASQIQFLPAEQIGGPDSGGHYGASVANLNADDYPDLLMKVRISSGTEDEYVFIALLNNGGSGFTCDGDITGDGSTGVDDLLGVIGDWGCTKEGLPD